VRVIVDAPARLHLGFLDLNGQCGRRFGSIGVALERPRYVVEARRVERVEARGPTDASTLGDAELLDVLERLDLGRDVASTVALRVLEAIPRHAGFGSGTQRRLAVGLALSRVLGHPLSVRELARRLGRAQRSGVGVAAFEGGGFVVDAGQPMPLGPPRGGAPDHGGELPPVIFRHPLPGDWFFVLVTPEATAGLSGATEERTFLDLRPMDAATVGRICRLTLMGLMPAAVTGDIAGFGAAITEVQRLVGEHFAEYQGGTYASPAGRTVAEFALARGAHGVGQSSWGPTVFALVRGENRARGLATEIRSLLGDDARSVSYVRSRNEGAACRVEP
jgi:beta-ribofuranosylaminobenzene 5'-phosphate synthase